MSDLPDKMRAVVLKGDFDVRSNTPNLSSPLTIPPGPSGRPPGPQDQKPHRRHPQSNLHRPLRQRPALLPRPPQVPPQLHLRARVRGRDRSQGRLRQEILPGRQSRRALLHGLRRVLLLRTGPGEPVLEGGIVWQFRTGEHDRWWAGGVCAVSARGLDVREDAEGDPGGDVGVDGGYFPHGLFRRE